MKPILDLNYRVSSETKRVNKEEFSQEQTLSINGENLQNLKSSLEKLRILLHESKEIASENKSDCVYIADSTYNDATTLMHELYKKFMQEPDDIYYEEDTGHINISWTVQKSKVINILLRGDGYVILAAARGSNQNKKTTVIEGEETIPESATIIKNTYTRFSTITDEEASIKRH